MLLGEIFIAKGYCTISDIREALRIQRSGDTRRIGQILISMGKITLEDLETALDIQFKSATKILD